VNYWKVILATMVIFGTGVITGGLLVRETQVIKRPKQVRPATTNHPPAVQNVTPSQMQRLEFLVRANNELDLTPEQRERIERVIREGQERTRELWESISPDVRKELQLVRERIKAELTPEQRRRFDELLRRPLRPGARQNTNAAPESASEPATVQ